VKTSILKLFRLLIAIIGLGVDHYLMSRTHTRHADTLKRAVAA